MSINKKLDELFNLEDTSEPFPLIKKTEADLKVDDFELARSTMRDLIFKNNSVIDKVVDLAQNSESARVYEVAGQLIKAQSEVAKDLMNLHKQKKEVDIDSGDKITTQNNIVFAGSTSDLMKMISAERAKTIDSK